MRIYLLLLLILVGCSDNEITGKASFTDCGKFLAEECPNIVECPDKTCPKCVQKDCPTCEKCEKCEDCEECPELGSDPLNIELEAVRLFKQQESEFERVEERFTITDMENFQSGQLSFTPMCDSADEKLSIMVNNGETYGKVPNCKKAQYVDLVKSRLKSGSNKIVFYSEVKDSYRLENIELKLKYKDDTEIIDYGYVRLEEEFYETKEYKDLGDDAIKNYVEFSVKLGEDDIEDDLMLRFDSDNTEGKLIVYFNKDKIYEGDVDQVNEIILPKKYLEEGKNTLKLVGIS